MKLQLKNPIVFFDLETTGTNIVSDRIVEISYHKVSPNGREETKTIRINPEMPIPKGSSDIHGITDADVADCPTFKCGRLSYIQSRGQGNCPRHRRM